MQVLPLGWFVAGLMQLSVMATAERHGEFGTDFKAYGSWLSQAQSLKEQLMAIRHEGTDR
jgi:hypothetical protein